MSSASSSSSVVTANINYKTVEAHPGHYRFLKVPLNNQTSNQVSLDAISSQLLEWKLPVGVMNLGKSYLSYNIELTAAALNYNYAFNDVGLPFAQQIQFGTASGMYMADLNYANNFLSVARKIDTPMNEYLSNDALTGLSKHNGVNPTPTLYTVPAGSVTDNAAGNGLFSTGVLEPQYLRRSENGGANGDILEIAGQFPLSALRGTVLGMDRDQFFGDTMYLRINTAPSGKVGFLCTGQTPGSGGNSVFTVQPVLKNLFLYIALEKDVSIIESIMAKFAAGSLKYHIPFTYTFRNSTSGTQSSVQVNLTSQYGKKLRRMLHSAFPASETVNSAYDHANFNGSKITSYQTYIDSQPLQDQFITTALVCTATPNATMDDWRENKQFLVNAPLQGVTPYQLNWFHCDSFQPHMKEFDHLYPDENVYGGLDLTLPKQWSISLNTANVPLNQYTFAQFIREIQITPAGPVYV